MNEWKTVSSSQVLRWVYVNNVNYTTITNMNMDMSNRVEGRGGFLTEHKNIKY